MIKENKPELSEKDKKQQAEEVEKLRSKIDAAREELIRELHISNLKLANKIGQLMTEMVEYGQEYGESRAGRKIMSWATDMEMIYTAIHRRKSTMKEVKVAEKLAFKERLRVQKNKEEVEERVGPRIG